MHSSSDRHGRPDPGGGHAYLRPDGADENVGHLRRSLRHWLGETLGDDPDVVDDLTLAASEALENAADDAFVAAAAVGTMCLRAADDGRCITVVVSDDGHWLPPDPDTGHRGRGIALIDSLADVRRVRPSAGGTSVTLVHHRVPASGHGRSWDALAYEPLSLT